MAFESQYQIFRKPLRVRGNELLLSEVMEFINKIVVDPDRKIMVKWYMN